MIASGSIIPITKQTTKKFDKYIKILVQFHNWSTTTPNYIYFNLHGRTISGTTAHHIVYGVKGYFANIDPKVYDSLYVSENGKINKSASPWCVTFEYTARW